MSRAAVLTLNQETDLSIEALNAKATVVHRIGDVGAAVASGSFITRGMVIAPCSIRTLGEIATGVTSSLLTRAADVTLKERRRLVLMVRETPLHLGHLRAMTAVTEMGAIVAPPMPAFYARPRDLAEMVDQTVGRVLDLFRRGMVRHEALERHGGSVVSLWDWAGRVWGKPGVSGACLALQDDHGQCVPLLLWALWRLEQDDPLVDATIDEAVARCRTRYAAIATLRAARRAAAPPERQRLRLRELAAERDLLDDLEAVSGPRRTSPNDQLAELSTRWGSPLNSAAFAPLIEAIRAREPADVG